MWQPRIFSNPLPIVEPGPGEVKPDLDLRPNPEIPESRILTGIQKRPCLVLIAYSVIATEVDTFNEPVAPPRPIRAMK